MKKILFFLFLSLSAFLNANEKNNKLADLLHSFGNNGEYAQMDSVYNLIIHEDHYKQGKLYALNITLDYARFLNQKGDSERANTLLTQIRDNAMALESLLTTLREYHPHRLVCLFGCGGNRSRLRRYEMGEVAGKLADLTIITSDNPRDEEPQAIIDDIKTGMARTSGKYVEIIDRKEAIAYAIHHGEPGDIIVLAGKGHEDYQEIKGKKYPMDERVLIADILAGK